MADEFDAFLANALAPAEREPDRRFVMQVQARIVLDDSLRAQRRALLSGLALQVAGLLAVAAGLIWTSRSPAVSRFAAESPALVLAIMLALFSLLLILFSSGREEIGTTRAARGFSKA
jgi:hypothetical protein